VDNNIHQSRVNDCCLTPNETFYGTSSEKKLPSMK